MDAELSAELRSYIRSDSVETLERDLLEAVSELSASLVVEILL